MKPIASSLRALLLALCLSFPFVASAEDARGFCISITGEGDAALATKELPRSEAAVIRGELGAADETIAKTTEGELAKDAPLLILSIEAGKSIVKVAFPISGEAWKKKLAVLDHKLPKWEDLGELDTPGKFTVGGPVGLIFEDNKLTFFPENSDPLVAPLQ